jgi:hypothetical protein
MVRTSREEHEPSRFSSVAAEVCDLGAGHTCQQDDALYHFQVLYEVLHRTQASKI